MSCSGQVLAQSDLVDAARAIGAGPARIVVRYLLQVVDVLGKADREVPLASPFTA